MVIYIISIYYCDENHFACLVVICSFHAKLDSQSIKVLDYLDKGLICRRGHYFMLSRGENAGGLVEPSRSCCAINFDQIYVLT